MVRRAAESGFNMNSARKGMNFRVSDSLHMFGRRHRRYKRIIGKLLDRDMRRNPSMSPREAAARLNSYADKARYLLTQSSWKLGK
tara:strand:+ start:219 stop:473 length:255 start_codon:yes stop_codon:yes gene_type:complete